MPNILLVYPKFPLSYWGFQFAMDFIGRKACSNPGAYLLPPRFSSPVAVQPARRRAGHGRPCRTSPAERKRSKLDPQEGNCDKT
jgi:hypothetical protein